MNERIDRTNKKTVGRLKLLTKIGTFLTVKIAITVYNSMILPLFTYCSLLHTSATNIQRKRMKVFEKRASKIVGKENISNTSIKNTIIGSYSKEELLYSDIQMLKKQCLPKF